MREVLEQVDRWTGDGARVALATVVGVRRSAPQPVGAKLAADDRGRLVGAVSGGCVEGAVLQASTDLLAGRVGPHLLTFGIPDDEAFDIGLPCGGEIDVWVEPFVDDAFVAAARTDGRAARVTLLVDGAVRRLVVTADGATEGTLGREALDGPAVEAAEQALWTGRAVPLDLDSEAGSARVFVDVVAPAPRLLIVGAVDLARALCTIARTTGWRPTVIDPRATFATPERFPDADDVVCAWPGPAFTRLGLDPATAVAVLTHDPKIDDQALLATLPSPAFYVGALGSRHSQALRRERLVAAGLAEDLVDARLRGPIGLDLGGSDAQETALSIMAEIVAARHGRDGGALRASAGRIHDLA